MAFSPEIKRYAKELFLTLDNKGNRKYSFEQISSKIQEIFNKKISPSIISIWAKKEKWYDLLDKAIISTADPESSVQIKQLLEKEIVEVDNELVEKLAKIKRWLLVQHVEVAKRLYESALQAPMGSKQLVYCADAIDKVARTIYEMVTDALPPDKESLLPRIFIIH